MRSAAAILLFTNIIFPQDHVVAPAAATSAAPVHAVPRLFALPGGVAFEIKNDEMTDALTCSVSTPLFGVYAVVDGRGAVIRTGQALGVDYNEKAILRIGEHEPFDLYIPQQPNTIVIPPSHAADFVGALYARERIRLRFTQWPAGSVENRELEIGDFAAGYDLGVELCGWPKPSITRVPLSHEPEITRRKDGQIYAKFGGLVDGWSVFYDPRGNYCAVKGPFKLSVATFVDGRQRSDPELGTIKYFTSRGQYAASTEHRAGTPAPVIAIANGAAQVGDEGMIEVNHHLYSLFGLRDALQFAAKTCNQPLLAP